MPTPSHPSCSAVKIQGKSGVVIQRLQIAAESSTAGFGRVIMPYLATIPMHNSGRAIRPCVAHTYAKVLDVHHLPHPVAVRGCIVLRAPESRKHLHQAQSDQLGQELYGSGALLYRYIVI